MKILVEVDKKTPCLHCGKPDWCYVFANGSTVCNRGNIANGWIDSGKTDKNGAAILYPESWQGNAPKPKVIHTKEWVYNSRNGQPIVKVIRQDLDNGKKKIFQNYFVGERTYKTRPKSITRDDIPVYRLNDLKEAIKKGDRIYVVEGEKCADKLWAIGLPATCNIQGSNSFSQSDLQDLADAQLVLVPDRDVPGLKLMEQWARFRPDAEWLYCFPEKDWSQVPASDGVDIYDWVSDRQLTADDVRAAVGQLPASLTKVEVKTTTPIAPPNSYINDPNPDRPAQLEPVRRPYVTRYYGEKQLNARELLDFITVEMGDRLIYDELRCEILFDGKLLDVGADIEFWFMRNYGESSNPNRIYNAILNVAKENSFNPVHDYLERCRNAPRVPIHNIAERHFGRSEPIYNRMVEMWLVSAIARAKDPGCQVDHCLVLQSNQGKYKSTWFATLFGEFFTDSVNKNNFGTPNSIMTIHTIWGSELAEIDSITSTKEAGQIKSFLTARTDYFRKPYAREIGRMKRPCVFCGTVNPSRFLVDDENRRFWPIPIPPEKGELDIELIKQERDGIWASALDAYEAGAIWWPNESEKIAIRAIMENFEDMDVWTDIIENYLSGREWVSIFQILINCLNFDEKDCTKQVQRRIGRILHQLGWTAESKREIDGKTVRVRLAPKKVVSENTILSGNNGKSIATQDFQTSQITSQIENNGKHLGSPDNFPDNFPDFPDFPDNGKSETLAQSAISHYSQIKSHSGEQKFSEQNPEYFWREKTDQKLNHGTWIKTSNEVVARLLTSNPFGTGWAAALHDDTEIEIPESEITHVWEV